MWPPFLFQGVEFSGSELISRYIYVLVRLFLGREMANYGKAFIL